jgi:hypothetical protein
MSRIYWNKIRWGGMPLAGILDVCQYGNYREEREKAWSMYYYSS